MADRALVPVPPVTAGEVRALQVYDVVPAGCIGMLIMDDRFGPHLRPGEVAIVDTTDKGRQPGELYALHMERRVGTQKTIVQLLRRGFAGDTSGVWYSFGFRKTDIGGGRSGTMIDGPLNPIYWPDKCVGRVVGVMPCFADLA